MSKRSEEPKQKKAEAVQPTVETKEVIFLWNRPIARRKIVLQPAQTIVTAQGPMKGPEPAVRLVVSNGIFKTSDPEIIGRLRACPNFGQTTSSKGFREVTKDDVRLVQLQQLAREHGIEDEKGFALAAARLGIAAIEE